VGSLVAGWREGAAHRSSAARADLCTLDHYEVTPNQAYDIQLNGAPSNDSLPSRRRRDRDPLSLPRLWSSAGQHTDPSQREARQVHKGLDIESIDNALDTSEGPTWVGRALRSMSPGLPSTFPDPGPLAPTPREIEQCADHAHLSDCGAPAAARPRSLSPAIRRRHIGVLTTSAAVSSGLQDHSSGTLLCFKQPLKSVSAHLLEHR